LSVPLPT